MPNRRFCGRLGVAFRYTPRMQRFSIHVAEEARPLPPEVPRVLSRHLARIARAVGLSEEAQASVGVRIVGDEESARLHMAHMGLEGPTDVLSFPMGDPREDPSTAGVGDIALNWAQVRRQARGHGIVGWMDEATVLLVHGFVHLLGHDHRTRREGRRMHRVEQRLLRRLRVADIPRPYGSAG